MEPAGEFLKCMSLGASVRVTRHRSNVLLRVDIADPFWPHLDDPDRERLKMGSVQ